MKKFSVCFTVALVGMLFSTGIASPTIPITVELKNGAGAYITSGATLRYNDGAWKTDAINNGNGTWTVNPTAGSLYYEMTYNYGVQQIGPISTTTTTVTFQTTSTTIRLETGTDDHTGLVGGAAQYTQGGVWHAIGTASGGNSSVVELLPVSYYFGMTYNFGYQQNAPFAIPGSGGSYTVTFRTTAVTVRLETNTHAGLDGGVTHYTQGAAWQPIGSTSGGNAPVIQLLPGSYYFDMDYNHGHQQLAPLSISGATQTVTFTTTATTVRLETSGHVGIDGAAARYNQGAWWDIGTTAGGNAPVVQLLPGSYYFDIAYNNGKQQIGSLPVSGTAQTVTFQTTKVTVRLENNVHVGLAGGVARYNQGAWNALPNTDVNGNTYVELLPGSYYFDMDYNHGHQQLPQLAVLDKPQTVLFQTTAVTIVGPDPKEYNQGAWYPFPGTIDLLPGNYYFRLGGSQVGPYAIAGSTFYRAFITVELRNGAGGFITSGATLRYHDGAWKTNAVDNHNGTFSVVAEAASLYYEMTYNYGKQQSGPLPGATSLVTFQTTATTVRLANSTTAGFAGGVVRFNQGAWNAFGTTIAGGNTAPVELLPGSYYFDMDFNHGHQQLGPLAIAGSVPHAQTVLFQTTTTTIQLLSGGSSGGLGGGVARFNQTAWFSFGTTAEVSGLTAVQELLPGSYYFDMEYNHGRQQLGPLAVTGAAYTVPFTTTTTKVQLLAGGGGLIGGVARFNQTAWFNFGTTAEAGLTGIQELMPGNYYFDMAYNNGRQQIGPMAVTGLTQTVSFTTTSTIIRLETHLAIGLDGGVARFNQGTWQPAGTTVGGGYTPVVELLPGSYYFDVVYNNGRQQIGPMAIAGLTKTVTFTTTAATVRLENCSHAGLSGGVARYNQGAWFTFGTTGGSGDTPVFELLPGNFYFDMDFNYGRQQVGPLAVSGGTQTVVFQTTAVAIGGTGVKEYNQGAWHTFTSPIDLLPGSYYFRTAGVQVGPVAVSGCSFNKTIVTISLKNHLSAPLAGGFAQWYNGASWVDIGTTPASGQLVAFVNTSGVYFNMKYKNATQQVGSFTAQDYIFNTTEVSLNLKDHSGSLITAANAGTAKYYSPTTSTWYPLGTTGTVGYYKLELLPVSGYWFSMTNQNIEKQTGAMAVGNGPTQDVDFKTTEVSLNLKDHNENLITAADAGTAKYYSPSTSTWYTLGTTGSVGLYKLELLPVSGCWFSMTYKNTEKQTGAMAVGNGPTQNVDFKTTEVSLNLKDHNNNFITAADAGTAKYYSPTTRVWYELGKTGVDGFYKLELLPVPGCWFSMTHKNVEKQTGAMTVGNGPTQDVDFKTTEVSLNLKDHLGNLITAVDAGIAKYYSPTSRIWYELGKTGTDGFFKIELLPVDGYWFSMTNKNVEKQTGAMAVGVGPTQDVNFLTALVTIHVQGSTGNPIVGAAVGHFSAGAWTYLFGVTDGGGNASMELLPYGSYYFNATKAGYGTMQVGPKDVAAETTPTFTIASSLAKWAQSESEKDIVPTEFALPQNYPNPFNPTTTIRVALPVDAMVNLTVYSVLGQKVAELMNGPVNAGYYDVRFDASNFASGLYIYRMTAKGSDGKDFTMMQKMILMK